MIAILSRLNPCSEHVPTQSEADDAITWYAVDRAVTVALTIPADTGTGPIQDVSTTIAKTLAAKAVF